LTSLRHIHIRVYMFAASALRGGWSLAIKTRL